LRWSTGDRGQATAELAMGLPTLVTVLFMAVWTLGAVNAQARCAEAARIGARAAARGESQAVVRAWAQRAAPAGATVTVSRSGQVVRVDVRAAFTGGASRSVLPSVAVSASAVAPAEDIPAQAPDGS
jgi:hypothetical protein